MAWFMRLSASQGKEGEGTSHDGPPSVVGQALRLQVSKLGCQCLALDFDCLASLHCSASSSGDARENTRATVPEPHQWEVLHMHTSPPVASARAEGWRLGVGLGVMVVHEWLVAGGWWLVVG